MWTDNHQRTSVPGLFAAGDVTGRMLLAHVAAQQGAVAADNVIPPHPTLSEATGQTVVLAARNMRAGARR